MEEQEQELINLKFEVIEEKIQDVKEEIGDIKKLLLGHVWKILFLIIVLSGFAGERVSVFVDSLMPDSMAAEESSP